MYKKEKKNTNNNVTCNFIDSPQIAQVYVPGARIPPSHFPDIANIRYYENQRTNLPSVEPPPAHRPLSNNSAGSICAVPPTISGAIGGIISNVTPATYQSLSQPMSHVNFMERERELRERELRERELLLGHERSAIQILGKFVC